MQIRINLENQGQELLYVDVSDAGAIVAVNLECSPSTARFYIGMRVDIAYVRVGSYFEYRTPPSEGGQAVSTPFTVVSRQEVAKGFPIEPGQSYLVTFKNEGQSLTHLTFNTDYLGRSRLFGVIDGVATGCDPVEASAYEGQYVDPWRLNIGGRLPVTTEKGLSSHLIVQSVTARRKPETLPEPGALYVALDADGTFQGYFQVAQGLRIITVPQDDPILDRLEELPCEGDLRHGEGLLKTRLEALLETIGKRNYANPAMTSAAHSVVEEVLYFIQNPHLT